MAASSIVVHSECQWDNCIPSATEHLTNRYGGV